MEILNAKKGRTPLQYRPRGVDEDEISDDEYYVMDGKEADVINEKELSKVYERLTRDYNVKGISLKETIKVRFLTVTGGDIQLSPLELEDDFKREAAFSALISENFSKMSQTLTDLNYSIGRSGAKDYHLLKSPIAKPAKKLRKKKEKRVVRFEDNFDFELPEKPEKFHKTFSEFQKYKSETSKLKNRPGKRSRDKRRTSHKLS